MIIQWVLAIIGMTAVGLLVWRGLQWQERREQPPDDRDDAL